MNHKSDTDGQDINQLLRKTQDVDVEFEATIVDPDYISNTENNNIFSDDYSTKNLEWKVKNIWDIQNRKEK